MLENPQECELLFKEFLIGVTGFFRDSAVWEKLKVQVFPSLMNRVPEAGTIRGWVPGCSTGEEAFTLAIIIHEVLESLERDTNLSVQIFATDLDTVAIEKARRGIYSENGLSGLTPRQIKRFFVHEGGGYRIHTAIREMVVFAPQNVIKDPPFTKLDFISCRNLLIYLEPDLQKKLLDLFFYSLRVGGILLLGSAESSGLQDTRFSTLDNKLRIYQKPEAAPQVDLSGIPYSFFQTTKTKVEVTLPENTMDNIQALTDALLLQKFTPPSVLVNDKGDILYITGRIGKFLEPAAGKVNMNIFAMAREGIRGLLLTSFRKIGESKGSIILKKINVGGSEPIVLADITITRITTTGPLNGLILVVFSELSESGNLKANKSGKVKQEVNSHFDEVEDELRRCREELLSLQEEMQSSQEELRSTNEELLSTNEELQSTNEELTTSKEELQSLNEELQTVNMELQCKVDDYERIHNDMKNLLDSIEIATLFLDKGLNIRRFTKQLTGIYKVIDSDIGRPFTDLVSSLDYPQIEQEALDVLQTRIAKEKSVMSHDGKWFSVRIMPYRTDDERVEGLVITFMNISYTKKLEIELQDRIALLNATATTRKDE
jgi:two-component system CheB/CheR fusion protein